MFGHYPDIMMLTDCTGCWRWPWRSPSGPRGASLTAADSTWPRGSLRATGQWRHLKISSSSSISIFRWRVGEVLTRLLTTLKPFLDHPYHNVRSRLGGVLNNIFAYDLEFEGWGNSNKSSPHEADFLRETLPLLSVLKVRQVLCTIIIILTNPRSRQPLLMRPLKAVTLD